MICRPMTRRQLTVAVAILAIACVSPALAGGVRRGKGKPKPSTATTRTIVNNTAKSWYTYIYSGTGAQASTIAEGNAQGAKVIAPGGKGVFNVKPNGDGNPFGDLIIINATPPLDVNNPNANFRSWDTGNGGDAEYPVLQAGQTMTITITQTSPTVSPDFTPAP